MGVILKNYWIIFVRILKGKEMADNDPKSLDLFGIKPIANSIDTVTKGMVDGASAFLSRICLPAAEEFGLLLRDKISGWRSKNTIKIIDAAKTKLDLKSDDNRHAHPRLVSGILESGSWTDSAEVQDMWAGLLASSCTEKGDDESNLLFINILSQITSTQAKMLNAFCQKVKVTVSKAGWLNSEAISFDLTQLEKITGVADIHRIDRELDQMTAFDLIKGGFDPSARNAIIELRSLGIQMYVRCQGQAGDPIDFLRNKGRS